jgi:hypothetical protein
VKGDYERSEQVIQELLRIAQVAWVDRYNERRPHRGLGGRILMARLRQSLNNVVGAHTWSSGRRASGDQESTPRSIVWCTGKMTGLPPTKPAATGRAQSV